MPTVSQKWDIVSLFEHYCGVQTTGSSTVKGVLEIHSNCPWCPGSRDSFIMRPEIGQYTHMVRGGCPAHGDAIDLLMDTEVGPGMSREEAIEELALEGVSFGDGKPPTRRMNSSDSAPDPKWSEAAELILSRAERYLWHPGSVDGKRALDYLHARGLTDETIKKARMGYVPLRSDGTWYIGTFEEWGLDPETLPDAQRAKGGVRVPNGILIPWITGGKIWKLAVKRPGEDMSYGQVMGSVDSLYNVDSLQYGEIAMMTEGEIDCLSVQQEAGDLLNVIATGSSAKARYHTYSTRWLMELSLASFVLQGFDSDDSGDAAADEWLKILPRAERWPLMLWNDPNELLTAQLKNETEGFTLRDWVRLGIDIARNAMQQNLAREISEAVEVEFNPFEEEHIPETEESVSNPQEEDLVQFAHTVSMIVDIFGGPDNVQMQKHDGRSLNETYPTVVKPYIPVTLPPLPRTKCPHGTVTLKRASDEMSNGKQGRSCIGKVLANGWCLDHQGSQELLEIGSQLNYPDMLHLGKYSVRGIGEGVACWEAAAERYGIDHVMRDIKQIKVRFGL